MDSSSPAVPLLLLLLLLPSSFSAPTDAEQDPVVKVSGGQVLGRVVNQPGAQLTKYYAFEGIPYARPPIGERRFKDPDEVEPWSSVRNATVPGTKCIQKDIVTGQITGEEDCLFINVFTADPPESWADLRRPVAVWVHGGAFIIGSGDFDRLRPDPIMRQGIVVVSFNYRLGVMGFMNTEDSEAPGNAALKDAVLALRWVQKNIKMFGGDPDRVTIFGDSAGAAMVHYLLLTPLTEGLIHGAVAMSGSALSAWALTPQPRRDALALRRHFASSCPDEAPDAVAACLQRVDAKDLIENQDKAAPKEAQHRFWKNPFLPSVESPAAGGSPFLTAKPEQLMRDGKFLKVPYITGFTSAEGILYLRFAKLFEDHSKWRSTDENFVDIFRYEMPRGLDNAEAMNKLRDFYMGDHHIRDANEDPEALRRFVQLLSDMLFNEAAVKTAHLMAENGAPVFVYEFTHDSPATAFLKPFLYNASHVPGVAHGDDLAYLFEFARRYGAAPVAVPPAEAAIRERRVRLFTNFFKTGRPTPDEAQSPSWPSYTADKESYMEMDSNFTIKEHVLGERIAFWRRLASTSEEKASE